MNTKPKQGDDLTTEELIKFLYTLQQTVWYGSLGYDTRPCILHDNKWEPLPIEHEVGFADSSRTGYTAYEGSLNALIRLASYDSLLVAPDYAGSNEDGEWVFKRTGCGPYDRWTCLGYTSKRGV
jgi:hypothetical protein